MKSQQLSALPPVTEVFKNIGDLASEIVDATKAGELSKEEVDEYVSEFEEMIEILEDLKESLKKDMQKK